MKKIMWSIVGTVTIVGALLFYSCEKELVTDGNGTHSKSILAIEQNKSIFNDLNLIIKDNSLSSAEKTNQILNFGNLNSGDIKLIMNNKIIFEPSHLELIFASQSMIEDVILNELVIDKNVPDNFIFNVLATRNEALNPIIRKSLKNHRSNIDQGTLLAYGKLDKMICLCKNGIVFADEIIDIINGEELTVILTNPKYHPLNIKPDDVDILVAGCGKGWTCGEYSEVVKTSEDMTQTIGKCKRPPYFQKCVKIIKPNYENLMGQGSKNKFQFHLPNDYKLVKNLIENGPIDNFTIEQILRSHDRFDPASLELILLTSGKLNSCNLKRLSAVQSLNDEIIENILMTNTPLENNTIEVIKEIRPNLDFNKIQSMNDKEILISLCANGLLIGDKESISSIDNNTHEIVITNYTKKSFGVNTNSELISAISEGCGKRWICGELILFSEENTETKFRCVAPPNQKCALKAKEVKNK